MYDVFIPFVFNVGYYAITNYEKYYRRFYSRQFDMPYEDSRVTASPEPPYQIHA